MGIFQSIGIQSDFIIIGEFVLIIVLLLMIRVLFVRIHKLDHKYELFMRGQTGKNLEGVILSGFADMRAIKKNDKQRAEEYKDVREKIGTCYRKSGLVKYDAFEQQSGQLSFSFALLNDDNDGILISCMHSSEGCFTYAKEIIKGESFVALTDDEKKALHEAVNMENILAD